MGRWEGEGGEKTRREKDRKERRGATHSYPGGDEVDLVEDEDDTLMCLLLLEEVKDGLAHGTHGIPGVEDVDDNVRGVENLVELSPDSSRLPLGVDSLSGLVPGVVVAGGTE